MILMKLLPILQKQFTLKNIDFLIIFSSRLYNKFEYDKIHIDNKIKGDLNGNIKTTKKIF